MGQFFRTRIMPENDLLAGKLTFDEFAFKVDKDGNLKLSDDGKEIIDAPAVSARTFQSNGCEVPESCEWQPRDRTDGFVLHPDSVADGVVARDGLRDARCRLRRYAAADDDPSAVAAQPGHRSRDSRPPVFRDHASYRPVRRADTLALHHVLAASLPADQP